MTSGVCPHCDKLNRKSDYENQLCDGLSTEITEENIHLYYEFMSDEDLMQNSSLIDSTLQKRKNESIDHFSFKEPSTAIKFAFHVSNLKKIAIELYILGVKDTLKPIDEYIKEIKKTSEYEKYIQN